MVCGCKKNAPAVQIPSDMEWGPAMWKLLHGLAERSGSTVTRNAQSDERNGWRLLAASLYFVIPCRECKSHFLQYTKAHPFPNVMTIPYGELRNAVRTWFWALHEDVNADKRGETEVVEVVHSEPLFDESLFLEETQDDVVPEPAAPEDGPVTLDCLPELYGNINLRETYHIVRTLIMKFFITPLVQISKWYEFERSLFRLMSVYGA